MNEAAATRETSNPGADAKTPVQAAAALFGGFGGGGSTGALFSVLALLRAHITTRGLHHLCITQRHSLMPPSSRPPHTQRVGRQDVIYTTTCKIPQCVRISQFKLNIFIMYNLILETTRLFHC